ncbi:MAG: hypothetical protein WCT07_02945 [Candidatus Paceibacterota bacterium]|jgi:hypothetical protein
MKKLTPLDFRSLTEIRDQMLVYIDEILNNEKLNEQFSASRFIEPLIGFLFSLIKDTKPQVGFADSIIKRLFYCPLLYTDQLIYLFPFASKPVKEKIISFLVGIGFVYHVEVLFNLLGRKITEEEIKTIAIKNFGSNDLFQKSLMLADKYHPHIRNVLVEQKNSWDNDYCLL